MSQGIFTRATGAPEPATQWVPLRHRDLSHLSVLLSEVVPIEASAPIADPASAVR